jgi:uncharacterized SAM-binding protein YcdF (DUF218 family)
VIVVTSTYHVTRARLIFRRALDRDVGVVSAGVTPAHLPRDVALEWAKLALAVLVRRAA